MALSYRHRKKWREVGLTTLAGLIVGFSYTGLRMLADVVPFLISELETSTRIGGAIGFCLGLFFSFIVYDTPGVVFRRMGFMKGWLTLSFISVSIICFCLVSQRAIALLFWSRFRNLRDYFQIELAFDVLIAVLFFLSFTFVIQMRRLIGEGIMWNMITGRYHEPRIERRIYMFLDIKGSITLAERLGDIKVHALISDVFFIADRLVSEHRGEVLSFNGDELVASWIEDKGLQDGRCLSCYKDTLNALDAQADRFQKEYGVKPELWAGFHTGEVVVGECGDSKLSIVHIGDTPNTAARLEQHAKETGRKCLASGNLMSLLEVPDDVRSEALGTVTLKGHSHDTEVFAVELA